MSISIVIDTLCDVPKAFIKKYGITVMPLTVHFGDESYLDGVDITPEEFFNKLSKANELPKTSQVTPAEFQKVFEKEIKKGKKVLTILGSSKLSGTHDSAVMAKEELSSGDIYIIDSESISLGAGMLVIKAARLIEEGKSIEEVFSVIQESKKKMKHLIILGELKYIYKGGRISLSSSVLGSVLNIKPMLTVIDGKLEMLERSRGMKKAIFALLDIIKNNGYDLNNKTIGINHSICPEYADFIEQMIKSEYDIKEIIRGEVGSVIGTHAGPNCVAVYFEE